MGLPVRTAEWHGQGWCQLGSTFWGSSPSWQSQTGRVWVLKPTCPWVIDRIPMRRPEGRRDDQDILTTDEWSRPPRGKRWQTQSTRTHIQITQTVHITLYHPQKIDRTFPRNPSNPLETCILRSTFTFDFGPVFALTWAPSLPPSHRNTV